MHFHSLPTVYVSSNAEKLPLRTEGNAMDQGFHARALVVEDEASMRKLVVRVLTRFGFQCDGAIDGLDAEQHLAAAHYDLVITDLKMPNRHGHLLAVHVLSLKPRPALMIHTGVIEPKLADELIASGVDEILTKPIDLNILAAKAVALVERRTAPT
jgi:two-component system response regulator PilR (NtrC family)